MIQILFILLIGLVFGSFVTLASYRLPLSEDIAIKPSRCPRCEAKLTLLDLWPVLSWLAARGRCRHCQTPISPRYPAIEIVTAAMFAMLFLEYGLAWQGVILALLGVALMVMIVVDLEHTIIPDQVHYALLPLGLAYHAVTGGAPGTMLWGFLLGAGIGLALHYGYRALRKREGLGFGDVKFLAVAGLWLGWQTFVPFLFFSGLLGIITGLLWRALGRGPIFPFGPALALALFALVAFPETANLFWKIGEFLIFTI